MKRLNLKHGDLVPGLPEGWTVRVVEGRENIRKVSRSVKGNRVYSIVSRPGWAYGNHCDRYTTSVEEVHKVIRWAERERDARTAEKASLRAAAVARLTILRALDAKTPGNAADQACHKRVAADRLMADARRLNEEAKALDELHRLRETSIVTGEVKNPYSTTAQDFHVRELEEKEA
jgi:hypothetical protein